ncbi:hypothetical protein L228DRAFT_262139 [Xylona heveae TC161]|uniref:Pre-rRNA-processing protein TSR2 n=1 Tax=Xylona heveae (strain CBS 132557 / TC161) TaxID=1328760 RepID=A0A165FKH2_XYLHT|nr:hypothetical protein L228DRAFT_262139 [Xylona heveae TC161]KZF21082.1 hypothetical protein L228DRAFT_262139 [Xylona heveae TC161]
MATNMQTQANPPLPSAEIIQSQFDMAIALALANWPALTLAVQNQWGGPDSADKRDWFAGAVSDLFLSDPETDAQDVEDMLLQVMNDEFDVNVDDDSALAVANEILLLRKDAFEGNFNRITEMQQRWSEKKGKSNINISKGEGEDESDSDDSDESEDDYSDMGDNSRPAAAPKPKPVPEVDDDGFTKVVGKKR